MIYINICKQNNTIITVLKDMYCKESEKRSKD